MKTLNLTLALTLLTLGSFGQKLPLPADKKATRETVLLFQSLYELKNKGVMYGHQDDLMYGYTWWYEKIVRIQKKSLVIILRLLVLNLVTLNLVVTGVLTL